MVFRGETTRVGGGGGGGMTTVRNRGETNRGEKTRGEMSWGRNVLLSIHVLNMIFRVDTSYLLVVWLDNSISTPKPFLY